ncbi:hypothetical protein JHK86_008552 [Glycine max]|nr:hypothetical protein JHK86_008552 [Glycine max]
MNSNGQNFLRLEDRKSEPSFRIEIEDSINDVHHERKVTPSLIAVLKSMGRRLEKMKNWRRDSDVLPVSDGQRTRKKILDPQGPFL